jgi:pyruvate,orthophosphate dikinase
MILAAPEYRRVSGQAQSLRSELEGAKDERKADLSKRLTSLDPILADLSKQYLGSLEKLGRLQKEDFLGILRAMAGLPVIIRLIDPPLHEFLPNYDTLLVQVTKLRLARGTPGLLRSAASSKEDHEFLVEIEKAGHGDLGRGIESLLPQKERLLAAVEATKEANPMLGLRGCRLGITYPEITQMQVRAIFEAACQLKKESVEVHPEIMIPLVGHVHELEDQRAALESEAQSVMEREGVRVDYKFGTMIEIPRAALTADEIAQHAEFFSFGTNDLTQTTFGYSRDDAEGKFLLRYVEEKILPFNPFQTIDREGVGQLMRMCVQKGRKVRPTLEIGICGEHGGDPSSIELCDEIGLNYVSCSPYRVPVARLAAAHAKLHGVTSAAKDR